tara:strand:- start:104 stop:616 length:513 start_codon:yes stop_codon:yes gene_type:complete
MTQITVYQMSKIKKLLTVVIVIIVVSGVTAYKTLAKRREDEGKNKLTVAEFFGFNKPFDKILKAAGIGMISGFVFGLIDNGGLFFGMDALEPVFAKYFPDGDNELVKSGLGNTFSDAIGGFIGTFIGMVVQNTSRVDEYPFWAETLGLVLGCLLGVYLPWSIMKKSLKTT